MARAEVLTPGRRFTVTFRAPESEPVVALSGRTVSVDAPGYHHEHELPDEVDGERLSWEVFHGVFELHAPFRGEGLG